MALRTANTKDMVNVLKGSAQHILSHYSLHHCCSQTFRDKEQVVSTISAQTKQWSEFYTNELVLWGRLHTSIQRHILAEYQLELAEYQLDLGLLQQSGSESGLKVLKPTVSISDEEEQRPSSGSTLSPVPKKKNDTGIFKPLKKKLLPTPSPLDDPFSKKASNFPPAVQLPTMKEEPDGSFNLQTLVQPVNKNWIKCGYLWLRMKLPNGRYAWTHIYCVVDKERGELMIQEQSLPEPRKLENLMLCNTKPCPPDFIDRNFCFRVITPSSEHLFQTTNQNQLNSWVAALQETTEERLKAEMSQAKEEIEPDKSVQETVSDYGLGDSESEGDKDEEIIEDKEIEPDKEIVKDDNVEDANDKDEEMEDIEIEPDKFIQEIEEAMSRNETISRKLAHGMFVGPTGTGKSSLMDRLLGRARKQFSPSTGVSESVVVVNVGIDNPSTFHSVTVESDVWKEEEYNVSLVRQMEEGVNTSQPKDAFATQMEEGVINYQPKDGASSLPPIVATQSLANREFPPPTESAQLSAPVPVSLSSPLNLPQVSEILMAKLTTTPIRKPPMKEVIRFIILKHGGYKKFKRYLKKTFSLYLRDTGGQVEFQEMLPLLIFGPSIFFFVFRLDLDFRKKFTVEYRVRPGESLNCYTSSITTEEAFLQCLASVYAMDMPGMAGIKTHKPLVFIVGTHKDKLGPLADEKIANLNQYLSVLVKNSGFDDLVLSADRDKDQIMFTVDNTSESDEDFKPIRSMVSSLVSGRQEFAIDYPISYLLFCLELQNVKRGVVSLDECKVIAAKYGIEGDQILHLLQFLHLRIGVIRYFDKDGVRHIVIKEPQILFNKVTSLIIKTFSCKALTKKEADDFEKKGILTESAFASIVSGDGNITPEEFLRLLVHLRVIALFTSPENRDKEKRYFVPSVLNHIAEFCEEDPKTDILPLAVKFKCEHCPKGLFGVVVTHLMAPDLNKGATSNTTFTLMQDKIFKNQVSFEVHSPGVQDEMALLVHPSHLEIKFFPEDAEHSEDRDTSIAEVCNEVRQILETSICSALQDLHYNISNVEPMMCISCEKCSDLHQVKKGKKSWKIHCKKIKRSVCVASHGRCWFNEDSDGEVSSHATANKPVTFPPPLTHVAVKKFLKPLTNVEIKSVGLELGLRHPRLKNMREDTLLDDMLDSWLREDDDVSETSGTPSWESLVKALEEADYNGVAANIRKENL